MAERHRAGVAIVTLCVRGGPAKTPANNARRTKLLYKAVIALSGANDWPRADAIVLPAGFFRIDRYLGDLPDPQRLTQLAKEAVIRAAIDCCSMLMSGAVAPLLILGVDSLRSSRQRLVDQWCIVCSGTGLIAAVRKIFPTALDIARGFAPAKGDYRGAQRVITLGGGRRALLCVCYDLFGVTEDPERPSVRSTLITRVLIDGGPVDRRFRQFHPQRRACVAAWRQLLERERPVIAIAVIHRFERPGLDGYWQRHGIATASAALGGFAVGAAHFGHLPTRLQAPLAASRVPRRHLAEGNHRQAWPHLPDDDRPVTLDRRTAAVLRLYRFTG